MRPPALICALALAGCATTAPPKVVTVEVKTPIAVACVPPAFPGRPTYPDTRAALAAAHARGPDAFDQLITAGWPLRDARLEALEHVVEACR